MPTPLINTSNMTGNFIEFTTAINDASGGVFMTLLLFVVYILLFIAWENRGVKVAMLAVSFVMSILATLAWFIGWISPFIVIIIVVMFIFSVIFIRLID